MRFARMRRVATAVAASALLVTGAAVAAPHAAAAPEPSADALAAKSALDGLATNAADPADVIAGIEAANKVLNQLGITPFTPTLGACTDMTITPAVGGAVPGPYTPGVGNLALGNLDLNAVQRGELLFGFVPVGVVNDSADKSGMQVAWFNINTMQGSIGDPMGGISDTILDAVQKRIAAALPAGADVAAQALVTGTLKPALNAIPQAGVRGALVDTDAGTVVAGMYGTVKKGDATCYYFPSLGIATVS